MYAFLAFDVVKRMKVIFDYPEYPGIFWCFKLNTQMCGEGENNV